MTAETLEKATETKQNLDSVERAHERLEKLHTEGVGDKTFLEVKQIVGDAVGCIAQFGAPADLAAIIQLVQARSLQTLRTVRHEFAVL